MNRALFMSFNPRQREILYRCCRSGADNPDSEIGCYLMHPSDVHEFKEFFGPLIHEVHGDVHRDIREASPAIRNHEAFDVSMLGLPQLSIRVRVGRNLKAFNLPGNMDRAERLRLEKSIVHALQILIDHPDYGGRVYSLTPEFSPSEPNANRITPREYQSLVDAHIMFKDLDADPYLKSAGISADWPYGRACYVSTDKEVIVWIGEEDHLRIICMKQGTKLMEPFDKVRKVLALIETIPGIEFAHDENFGYITSCPSNLGTAMRVSVHVTMPHLANGAATKAICKQFGLSAQGLRGDHAPIGTDGAIELSPSRRFFATEQDLLTSLYQGLREVSNLG